MQEFGAHRDRSSLRSTVAAVAIMTKLSWKKVRAGVYAATSQWGLYSVDGNNYGRLRWTVTYPDGDFGMADSLGEAKAWAAVDADQRERRGRSA